MHTFKNVRLSRLILAVAFCLMVAGCSASRNEVRKLPEGYTLYSDGYNYRWSNKAGISGEKYYTKGRAVEGAWGDVIAAEYFSPGTQPYKILGE